MIDSTSDLQKSQFYSEKANKIGFLSLLIKQNGPKIIDSLSKEFLLQVKKNKNC